MQPASLLRDLVCLRCDHTHDADRVQTVCARCGGPLSARYDMDAAGTAFRAQALAARAPGVWRYAELLPVRDPAHRLDLGEGGTPLLQLPRLGERLRLRRLMVKDEGPNPTGSFKARGLCLAVSRARELGLRTLAIPTAGNAGSALAAYCARGGLEAVIYVPRDTPAEFLAEYRALGARVTVVEGTIADAGARLAAEARQEWFPVSTLREPYRLEGKKTMGIELAEQLGWRLPDAIVYPTGGGTGLIGMWKAFDELEQIGLLGSARPRMIAVQAQGCAPIVRAFEAGADSAEPWRDARTLASGLRVPAAFADREILHVLRASAGDAIAVSDRAMLRMLALLGRSEGIYAAPEAAATLAAVDALVQQGRLDRDAEVVCFLTGSGYKYSSTIGDALAGPADA